MGKRRKYSAEFKREAVALANDPRVTKSQIARELGISANVLGRWSRELKERGCCYRTPETGRICSPRAAKIIRENERGLE